jgi:hypothetical protein
LRLFATSDVHRAGRDDEEDTNNTVRHVLPLGADHEDDITSLR